MQELLQKAFDNLVKLPDDLQNQIAVEILEEIEWEKEWDKNKTNNKLDELINKTRKEHLSNKTHKMGFDEL